MTLASAVRAWLIPAWWVLVPPFVLLVVRLVYERACWAPYELLPEITSNALLAWPLAMLYLGVHGWVAIAYLVTVEEAGSLIPTRSAVRSTWGAHWPKLVLTAAILALEYSPIPFWRLIGQSVLACTGN